MHLPDPPFPLPPAAGIPPAGSLDTCRPAGPAAGGAGGSGGGREGDTVNAKEYADYEHAYTVGTKGLDALSSGRCHSCQDCNPEELSEEDFSADEDGGFSWTPCEICDRSLGGDRYAAHYIDAEGTLRHLEICADCVYYTEYGQLDDLTMLEVEEERETAIRAARPTGGAA